MKSIILKIIVLFFLIPIASYSQSFYEFKWTADDGIDYKGFLIHNNDDHMTMRVAYTNNGTGAYKVSEYQCVRTEYTNENNKKVIKYDGNNAKIVYTSIEDDYGYNADNFYFIDVDKNYNYEKLYVDDDRDKPVTNTQVNYRKLEPSVDFTEEYLNQFYSTSDNTYKKLTNTGTSLSEPITHLVSKITFVAIGATNDPKLGNPIKQDIEKYNKFFKMVSKNLNIPYKSLIYDGDNFTKSTAINQVNNMAVDNKEVIIILYRGHGFRWADQNSDFPRMKLGDSFNEESYNFETLHRNLKNKNPRLLISIGDLCNNVEGISPLTSSNSDPISQDYSLTKLDIQKIATLLSKKGSIITVSAKPGEQSYSSYDYGFYSKSLMDALMWEISEFNTKSYASWDYILNDASSKARKMSLSEAQFYQNALTKINLN